MNATTTTTPQPVQPTKIRKSHSGWEAATYFALACGKQLKVSTWKSYSGIESSVQAVNVKPSNGGFSGESFMMFSDFSKKVMKHTAKKATEKSITQSHDEALAVIEPVIEEANTFYATEGAHLVELAEELS